MKNKFYYKDGSILECYDYDRKPHRVDGPAIEWADGGKYWYVDGKRHRVDGPACEYAGGNKAWYIDDKLHRIDGPAIEWASGTKYWYIDGKELTKEEFNMHPKVEHYRFQLLLEETLCPSNQKRFYFY